MGRNQSRNKNKRKIKSQKESLVAILTQAIYNKAIQIRRPLTRDDLEDALEHADEVIVNYLKEQNQKYAPVSSPVTTSPTGDTSFFQEQMELIADISTGLWRLQQRLINPDTGQPLEESRRAYRHFQSVWDAIHEAGFIIQDHTGEPFNARQMLKVITYEQKPGIDREIVSETIKPSVYYHKEGQDTMIQMGEVIVATPVNADNDKSKE